MKLVHKYMAIFFNFSPTSSHFRPLQVENCDSNSRLVVDEDDLYRGIFKTCSLFSTYIEVYLKHVADFLLISRYI